MRQPGRQPGRGNCVTALCTASPQVWRGTQKASEHALLDTPVAICSYISELSAPRLPALAVAAGECVCAEGVNQGAALHVT